MTDDTFRTRVQREIHLDDTTRATEASIATLNTLVQTLSTGEAQALADRLPPELSRRIPHARRGGGGQHAVGSGD